MSVVSISLTLRKKNKEKISFSQKVNYIQKHFIRQKDFQILHFLLRSVPLPTVEDFVETLRD